MTEDPQDDSLWRGECYPIDDHAAVAQGDILRWEQPLPPWQAFGVIVTGDCDIFLAKHAGLLSYVPILTLHEYWRHFTLPLKLDRYLSSKFLPSLISTMLDLQKRYKPGFPEPLSEPAIHELLSQNEADAVLHTLGVPTHEHPSHTRRIRAYRATRGNREELGLLQLAEQLAELRAASTPAASSVEKVLDELSTSVSEMPGDAFFIGRLGAAHVDGYVAYLRLIRELPTLAVATLPKDLVRPGVKARRIGRLSSPFLYRLTQQLGQVFADIGLPRQYEEYRAKIAITARSAAASPQQGL
jgi:hypothetical protein